MCTVNNSVGRLWVLSICSLFMVPLGAKIKESYPFKGPIFKKFHKAKYWKYKKCFFLQINSSKYVHSISLRKIWILNKKTKHFWCFFFVLKSILKNKKFWVGSHSWTFFFWGGGRGDSYWIIVLLNVFNLINASNRLKMM